MSTTPTITSLSSLIAQNTAKLNAYLTAHNLPPPSTDLSAPEHLLPPSSTPQDILLARQTVIDACAELSTLLQDPRERLMAPIASQAVSLASAKAIAQFRLVHSFPLGSSTTFSQLAASAASASSTSGGLALGETHIRQIIRHAAAAHGIFSEPEPGLIVHSAASRLLVEDPALHDWLAFETDELWPAACQAPAAMALFPASGEPSETGFSLANNDNDNDNDTTRRDNGSMFSILSRHPERLRRFASTIRLITQRPELGPELVADAYPWAELVGAGNTAVPVPVVVDVGGSHGLVSIELAKRFPRLRFVVQDLDEPVVRDADARKPGEVGDRVRFMRHDFFEEQPVKDADVYLLRAVLHNWSDKYAVRILRALVPALKKGARVVVNDVVLPAPGTVPKPVEVRMRDSDLVQLILNNAGQRELDEWIRLFETADSRFRFKDASRMPGSTRLWILVAEWEG